MNQVRTEKHDPAELIGKKILVLTAHPDDESFLAAGTLHKNQLAGGQNFLICATLGEKGNSHLDKPVSESELCEIREQELKSACDIIGVAELVNLGLPDGALDKQTENFQKQVVEHLSNIKPDFIMSFGPDGATGHRDHIAAAKVAQAVAQEFDLPLLQFCFPDSVVEEMKEWLLKRRAQVAHYEDDFKLVEGNLSVPIEGDVKLQALHCYASQIDQANPFSGFPDHVAGAVLTEECFKLIK